MGQEKLTANMGLFCLLKPGLRPTSTTHFVGLPPEVTEGKDERVEMPIADILILAETDRGRWMLYRYTKDGEDAGDTWHMELDEAKDQAMLEYGDALGDWRELPKGLSDPVAYVVAQIKI